MKNDNVKLKIFLLLAVLGAGFIFSAQEARAAGELEIYRISHPAYNMGNLWAGESNPWNQDYTRILMFEGYTHPNYPTATPLRYNVWGEIAILKSSACQDGTPQYWEANCAHPIDPDPSKWKKYGLGAVWSVLPDETNILYASYCGIIKRIDTDTGIITNVTNTGAACEAQLKGWTSDNKLVLNGYYEKDVGGYLIDVKAQSKIAYSHWPNKCSSDYKRFPYGPHSIHGDRSLDGKLTAGYSASGGGDNGIRISDPDDPNCNTGDYYTCRDSGVGCVNYIDWNPNLLTHISWGANNEWYVGANLGGFWDNKYYEAPPYITTYGIYQVEFNKATHEFTQNHLVSHAGAGFRLSNYGGGSDQNYHSIPSPTLSDNSLHIMYTSTDGIYSLEDKDWCDAKYSIAPAICDQVYADYGTLGVFIVDLAPAGSDTTPPAAPQGVTVQ